MNTNVLHDEEGFLAGIADSGILFEKACGSENIRVLKTGETTAITFGDRGVRNAECVHTFYDQILELIEQNQCRVLSLDMRGVWFLPSRTLGALMSLRKAVERIELQNVSDELRESLQITQLDTLFDITGCREVQTSDMAGNQTVTIAAEMDSPEKDPSEESETRSERSGGFHERRGNAAPHLKGKITQISLSKGPDLPHQGCGVISTPDGDEVYFHAENLLNVKFSKLELESEVHFVEDEASNGRHAKSVWIVSSHLVE